MLSTIKRYIEIVDKSEKSFDEYYIQYMKRVQDQNIDMEVRNQIRFGILQLTQFDRQIEADYRKLVNERNAKFA